MMAVIAALHIVVLVIFVAGGLLILVAYFLYRYLASRADINSNYTKTPPATLSAPAQVVYHCDVQVSKQPAKPLPNAEITFTLVNGHASIDGGASKTVKTDAKGDATVTLTPVSTGSEKLLLHLVVGSKSGDEPPQLFEVVKH